MTDYHAFWQTFLVVFAVLPALIGLGTAALVAWRKGYRGGRLAAWAVIGGAGFGSVIFAATIFFLRL